MPITLAVLNDYVLVVAGLRAVLEPYSDRVRVAELVVGTSVATQVDVVLHDTYASPYRIVPAPRSATGPGTPRRVVYTWDSDPDLVRAAFDDGVDGYLLTSASPDELVGALERIVAGHLVFPDEVGHVVEPVVGRWPGDHLGLSSRESEVLALICQGLSNVEISGRSYIGVNTVKTHVRSAYRKIGVTTRPQAVIWGLAHGFDKTPEDRIIY